MNWNATKQERDLIRDIASRAYSIADSLGIEYPILDIQMDLMATHANGCPLNLAGLASADKFNFSHDVFGIRRNLNRETGQLENCFVPRFAVKEAGLKNATR